MLTCSFLVHRGLRFSKRFFYFSDEPVEAKQLSVFQQNEKPAVANPIVAWATQTGKGLLFLTKRAEDKATPAGIFNLVSKFFLYSLFEA
jgi:L,D-peptidoglycan transpeptidase YkuD (ErfK/YbiS/YcfS/YnhG family)